MRSSLFFFSLIVFSLGGSLNAQQSTTTTLAATPNPVIYGQQLTLTATVTPSNAIGSVYFSDGATAIGGASVVSGKATFKWMANGAGLHQLGAAFVPGSGYAKSVAAPAAVTIKSNVGGGFAAPVSLPLRLRANLRGGIGFR